MNALKFILSFFVAITLVACDGDKKKPVYFDSESETEESSSETSYAQSGDEVVVPFRAEGGVKYVPVKVNGISFEMIFDTGCSGTLISAAEANYLYQKGKLSQDDIIGKSSAQIADGSIVENMDVNLEEVVIDDKVVCHNVRATVSDNLNAPLLLGNEILDRVANIKIDNESQSLIFKLK